MVEFESRHYLFFCQIEESCWQTSRHLPAIKAFASCSSLRKQSTFGDATNGFPAKWLIRNERRNSTQIWVVLLIGRAAWKIWRSTTQVWVVKNRGWRGQMSAVFSGYSCTFLICFSFNRCIIAKKVSGLLLAPRLSMIILTCVQRP